MEFQLIYAFFWSIKGSIPEAEGEEEVKEGKGSTFQKTKHSGGFQKAKHSFLKIDYSAKEL